MPVRQISKRVLEKYIKKKTPINEIAKNEKVRPKTIIRKIEVFSQHPIHKEVFTKKVLNYYIEEFKKYESEKDKNRKEYLQNYQKGYAFNKKTEKLEQVISQELSVEEIIKELGYTYYKPFLKFLEKTKNHTNIANLDSLIEETKSLIEEKIKTVKERDAKKDRSDYFKKYYMKNKAEIQKQQKEYRTQKKE
jgi:hypothetical protein